MDVLMPSTIGLCVARAKTVLAEFTEEAWKVQPKLPATKTQRMVTIRDDSGPDDSVQTRRRKGVNVWAPSPVEAENACLLLMAGFRSMPDGNPVTATDQFTGPFEVVDEATDLLTVGGVTLSHYYFAFRLTARGTDF